VTLLLYAQKQPWFAAYLIRCRWRNDGTLEDRMKNSIAAAGTCQD